MKQRQILYKIISCNDKAIMMQLANKAALFNLSWNEFLMPEYLCSTPKNQIFSLGTYYTQNMRDLDLKSKLFRDSEIVEMQKMILTEIRGGNYLVLDIKTNKLETISLKFILANIQLLEDFTPLQCFFLGIRAGLFYDQLNCKKGAIIETV